MPSAQNWLKPQRASQLIQACLTGIKDPRVERSRLHQLSIIRYFYDRDFSRDTDKVRHDVNI